MKVSDLKKALERLRDDDDVVIPVTLAHGTIGASPSVPVTQVQDGFDWDRGKVFICPDAKLYPVGEEFLQGRDLVREYSERIGFALNALDHSGVSERDRIKFAKQALTKRGERKPRGAHP